MTFSARNKYKVLTVSPSKEFGERLIHVLEGMGFVSQFAETSDAAFQYIRESQPDIVILDSYVEGRKKSNFVCEAIKSDPVFQSTQILMVTENNTRDEVNECVKSEADACISRLLEPDEILPRLRKAMRNRDAYHNLVGINNNYQDMLLEVSRINKEREEELENGSLFQKSLMYDVEALNREFAPLNIEVDMHHAAFPDARVSGDFWDVFRVSDEERGFLLADAVGHGIPAAFYSFYTLSTLRRIFARKHDNYFNLLSRELFRIMKGQHLAAAYCKFDESSITFCNAGLPGPVVVNEGQTNPILKWGPVLGAFNEDIQYKETRIPFTAGDVFLIYTDGLVEEKNEAREEFGNTRVNTIISRMHDHPIAELKHALSGELRKFLNGVPLRDDTTFVIFRRKE